MEYHEKNNLISLLNDIHMPTDVIEDILLCISTGHGTLPGINDLTDHLKTAVSERLSGVWKPFPQEIFINTMMCFSRFVNEYHISYGSYGYDRAFWTTRQISARLFCIGALEYELVDNDLQHIHLHIPSNTRLDSKSLNNSISSARVFFAEYFPGRSDNIFTTESWLLSPVLKELLPATSRILNFQSAFDITRYDSAPMACLEWVFNIAGDQMENVSLSDLPENTSLQKSMKKLLLEGGHVGCASGILVRSF